MVENPADLRYKWPAKRRQYWIYKQLKFEQMGEPEVLRNTVVKASLAEIRFTPAILALSKQGGGGSDPIMQLIDYHAKYFAYELGLREWEHDDYSLQFENLPHKPPEPGKQGLFGDEPQ